MTLRSDPSAPATVGFGRKRVLFLNPYTGKVVGEGSPRVRAFFRSVTEWHRWLGMQGERREAGRAVVGAGSLICAFMAVSGLCL